MNSRCFLGFRGKWLPVLLIHLCLIRVLAGEQDWPQFLGPQRNGVSSHAVIHPERWPESGPKPLWKKSAGIGFSSPVVAGNRVVVHHRMGDQDVVECFDATTGATLWNSKVPSTYRDDFGFEAGPRATPCIDSGNVFSIGADGLIQCHDLATGARKWMLDAREKLGAKKGFFGVAASPVVFGGQLLVCSGGEEGAGFIAIDKLKGAIVWKADTGEAGYGSPVVANIHGVPTLVSFARTGVHWLDPGTGRIGGSFEWRARSHASVNAASPLVLSNSIFLTASYDTGAVLLEMPVGGGKPVRAWSNDESLSCHYSTPVQLNGFLYGIHGRQEESPSLRCVDVRSGKVRWKSDGFGSGTLVVAGEHVLILHERGELVVLRADASSPRFLKRFQLLGSGVRTTPAIAGGVLFAKSSRELVALPLESR